MAGHPAAAGRHVHHVVSQRSVLRRPGGSVSSSRYQDGGQELYPLAPGPATTQAKMNGWTRADASEPEHAPGPPAITQAGMRRWATGSGTLVADTVPDTPGSLARRFEVLAEIPLFAEVRREHLLPLAAAAEWMAFESGQAIVRQGEPGESLYVIIEGRVQVVVACEHDGMLTEAVVSTLQAGETVGELSILDGRPRSATCFALGKTVSLRLTRADFLRALEAHWRLCRALLSMMAERLRQADRRLAEYALDPLTGLYSRRAFADAYEREAARLRRAYRAGVRRLPSTAVLFVDVDSFKEINDRFGHQTGDEVLQAVAMTLTASARRNDLIARHGGDEFVLLLPEAGLTGARRLAARVRRLLREQPPGPVPFTVSVGAAVIDPRDPPPLASLLTQADKAMYRDKARRLLLDRH